MPGVWRLVGDREGNFATIGAQQSRSEAALVEKIVNSVDARLMNECLVRGIDPTSAVAPPSIRHAVSRFFENREPKGEIGGTLEGWGFTIVRRERPIIGAGHVKNSVYSYLAPVNADKAPHRGGVLSFDAEALPLMPEQNKAYTREIKWGSAIKLYEYDM